MDDVTEVIKLVSTTSCMQMMRMSTDIQSIFWIRFKRQNKNLSTVWSTVSAPIGPTGC